MKTVLPLFLALAALPAALFAQDDELPPDDPRNRPEPQEDAAPDPAEEEAHAVLAAALRRYKNAEHLFVNATVRHEAPRQQRQAAGGIVIQRVSSNLFGGPPFEGEVEAWRGPDDVTVILSKATLPGFAMYVTKGRTVKEVTYEDGFKSLNQLKAELAPILDPTRFTRKLFDAKLRHERDAATGDLTFRGEVPREIVKVTKPPAGTPFQPMLAKVLKAHGTLVVTKEGRFRRIEIRITRNDPMAESMRGGGFRVIVRGGQPPQKKKEQDDDEKHDIEGGTTTYGISFDREGPSERAKSFKRRIASLLEDE